MEHLSDTIILVTLIIGAVVCAVTGHEEAASILGVLAVWFFLL